MTTPIRIFICYKKLLTKERDGKTIEKENVNAERLHEILSKDFGNYDPWYDASGLRAGMKWETEIYCEILKSEVLLALIGPGTRQSEWVRREIALAKALGITIVPLGFDLNDAEMVAEMEDLGIGDLQWKITQNIKHNSGEALISEIRQDLELARQTTKREQERTLSSILNRQTPPAPKAPDKQKAATFELNLRGRAINLHIASGDLAKVVGIDVLVNSENDYMQMARIFESRTVSSMLRSRGARDRDGRYEDTIQRELDWQLRNRPRPVQPSAVFVTSTGGPDSDLYRINKARYILHVAAVQAVAAESKVIPYKQYHQIEDCARRSLDKLAEINRKQGIISEPGTDQAALQEKLAADGRGIVRSVIFPLFGTGKGGCAPSDVVEPMLSGMTGFLEDPDNQELASVLTDIYLSAFKEQDFNEVMQILHARFG